VIHRDIKSANILISSEHDHAGLAKISDFGISKFISQDTTHSGTMIGTPNYMAPEQIEGLPLDGRSDQFSFAVVVYEMLTGTKPFRAENLATLFYQVCKQEPPPPHELNPSLPAQVADVIARGLAKDPKGRFVSCADFISALSTVLSSSGGWEPAPLAEAGTRTMATVAAAGNAGDRAEFARPPIEERDFDEAIAMEPVPPILPERSPQAEIPALPRRTRTDRGAFEHDEGDETRSAALRRKLLLGLAALAVAGVVFLLARDFHSEPSAPVVARSTSKSDTSTSDTSTGGTSTSGTTGTTAPGSSEQRPPEEGSKPAGQEPVREQPQPAAAPIPASIPSQVTITTQPPGARLVIDNRSETPCQSPCNSLLPPGRHTLTAELKGFDTARRIFTVPDERQLVVALSQSMGVLVVTTEPAGSTVIVDGKQYGATPLNVRLSVGTHQLEIVNGAGRHEETVQIESDQFTTRSFRWQ